MAATRVITGREFYTPGLQQSPSDSALPGASKVLVLKQGDNYIEVRGDNGLGAYIRSTEDGFEAHFASNEDALVEVGGGKVTATPGPVDTTSGGAADMPVAEGVYTHKVTNNTLYYTDGPSQARPPDGELVAGTPVLVLQPAGSYTQVRTAHGTEAYIATADLTPLPLPAREDQEGWRTGTLLNGWRNLGPDFSPAGYFMDAQGIVHLRGVLSNSSATEIIGSSVFVLPEGSRPAWRSVHTVITGADITSADNRIGRVDILPDGTVQIMNGQPDMLSLDGITFQAR
jgi:hypothetical protein